MCGSRRGRFPPHWLSQGSGVSVCGGGVLAFFGSHSEQLGDERFVSVWPVIQDIITE
jgi:hypothetical protein